MRTRIAYLEGGLEFALRDAPRPGKPKRYRADDEAKVVALASARSRQRAGSRGSAMQRMHCMQVARALEWLIAKGIVVRRILSDGKAVYSGRKAESTQEL